MFKSAVFLLVVFAVILKANSLQCHVCYDCEKLSDDYLTSCDSLLSTTTTSSTAQPTSTSTSTSTTPSSTITSTESTTSNSTTTIKSTTTSTTTPSTTASTTTIKTGAPQLQVSNFAERLERANTTWECVKGTLPVNGSDVIVRGCAAGHTIETCNMFGLTSCSFCSTDKCNAAGSIQASAAVLAVAFFAYIVKDF